MSTNERDFATMLEERVKSQTKGRSKDERLKMLELKIEILAMAFEGFIMTLSNPQAGHSEPAVTQDVTENNPQPETLETPTEPSQPSV